MKLEDYPQEVILPLLAVDFKDNSYFGWGQCAIEKSAMRYFKVDKCSEGVDVLWIGQEDLTFYHVPYFEDDFQSDRNMAVHCEDNFVIREIVLHKNLWE